MKGTKSIYINLWFFIPFLVWGVVGGILILLYSKTDLFSEVNLRYNTIGDSIQPFISDLGDGICVIPILLLLMGFKSCRSVWYFLTASICVGVPVLISQLIKNYCSADRPFKFFGSHAYMIHFNSVWGEHLMENSFPSGHTTGAFSMFCFISFLLPNKYRWLGLLFWAIAVMVGYSRIYLAAHFFEDVYAGSILGTVCTIICYGFMQLWSDQNLVFNAPVVKKN